MVFRTDLFFCKLLIHVHKTLCPTRLGEIKTEQYKLTQTIYYTPIDNITFQMSFIIVLKVLMFLLEYTTGKSA